MTEDREQFVAARKPRWERLERLLHTSRSLSGAEWSEVASLYRTLCADLSRAQGLDLDDVRAHLDDLAARAHNALYGARRRVGVQFLRLVAAEAPAEVRASWRFFLLSNLLFYGPFFVGVVGTLLWPTFAPSILPPDALAQYETMYSQAEVARGSGEDFAMAGFYVFNNVGIAFRCFATGALFGLGSMFMLVYNGLVIGTTFGYLFSVGNGFNLLQFVAGHSSWELTGIVVAGAAGLKLGWALIETQGLTRASSLKKAGPSLFRLVVASAALLFVAAAIEGFWSAGPAPAAIKYVFGAIQWFIVGGWLLFGGRNR